MNFVFLHWLLHLHSGTCSNCAFMFFCLTAMYSNAAGDVQFLIFVVSEEVNSGDQICIFQITVL